MTPNTAIHKVAQKAPTSFARFCQRGFSSQVGRFCQTPTATTTRLLDQHRNVNLPSRRNMSEESGVSTKQPTAWNEFVVDYGLQDIDNFDGTLAKFDMDELRRLAAMESTAFSLEEMYKQTMDVHNPEQRLKNAQFLCRELPIRLAQRAVDLMTLPHGLSEAKPIRTVAKAYLLFLKNFQETPIPQTPEEEEEFTDLLEKVVWKRRSIPNSIATGIAEWLEEHPNATDSHDPKYQTLEDAMYRFFSGRVGIRFLVGHHILCSPNRRDLARAFRKAQTKFIPDGDDQDFWGCIQLDCDVSGEVVRVASQVITQTEQRFGICPEIEIIDAAQEEHYFTYVPHILHNMVGELLQNSCTATVRRHLDSKGAEPVQPIRVVIVKGEEDVTIKVADLGGGMPRSKLENAWKFAHAKAGADDVSKFEEESELDDYVRGYGLPLARIHARYLGGDLELKSMEGYGLDAYLHLPRLGVAVEALPNSIPSDARHTS